MKAILSRAGLAALREFCEKEPLLVFDFDGTLSPIVRNPDRARMRSRTMALLGMVCGKYKTAVLSGRERSDVQSRLNGIPAAFVIGNHGLQWGKKKAPALAAAQIRKWQEIMQKSLSEEGLRDDLIHVENKLHSLSIHIRDPGLLKRAMKRAESLPGARVIAGKNVLNLLPVDSMHKGSAVISLAAKTRKKSVLFIGDDVTDEDVFSLDPPFRLLTIRVGRLRNSRAAYFLNGQEHMDAFLKELIRLRKLPAPLPGQRRETRRAGHS